MTIDLLNEKEAKYFALRLVSQPLNDGNVQHFGCKPYEETKSLPGYEGRCFAGVCNIGPIYIAQNEKGGDDFTIIVEKSNVTVHIPLKKQDSKNELDAGIRLTIEDVFQTK